MRAMVNCIASSSSAHMPPPHASTVSFRPAPAPNTARAIASTVSDMHTTHESGIQRWVKRDRLSPRLPTSRMIAAMGRGAGQAASSAAGGFAAYRQTSEATDSAAAPKNAHW